MIVVVSGTFGPALRRELEELVRAGFDGVEAGDVEVHVKARAQVRRAYVVERPHGAGRARYRRRRDALAVARRVGGSVATVVSKSPRAGWWTGRAYDGVPAPARVEPGVRYLVTMNIPADPRRLTRYPVRHRDPRLKTGPEIVLETWQDELFHIAAHEARHVHQFRHDLSRSELDAERWAATAIARRHDTLRPLTLFDP